MMNFKDKAGKKILLLTEVGYEMTGFKLLRICRYCSGQPIWLQ